VPYREVAGEVDVSVVETAMVVGVVVGSLVCTSYRVVAVVDRIVVVAAVAAVDTTSCTDYHRTTPWTIVVGRTSWNVSSSSP